MIEDPDSLSWKALSAVDRRLSRALRASMALRGAKVEVEQIELKSTVGYRLAAWVHRPAGASGALPGVVLCPGIDDSSEVFTNTSDAPVNADEVARQGFVVLRFDPAGRGDSWGEEDFGGPEHQDDVACAVSALAARSDLDAERIGIIAISLGVSMAVGAVALRGAPAAWVLDWEGPCDREIITSGGTKLAPADGHSLDDEVYWQPREAVRHVAKLDCAYVRLQALIDHAQPNEFRHAVRMIQAVEHSESLPWFQINDHPRSVVPPRPTWAVPGSLNAHRSILRKLRMLKGTRRA